MDLLVSKNLVKRFGNMPVVDNIDLAIAGSVNTAIAGETGCGKSTLLKMMGGLIEPDEGTVYFQGRRIEGPLTKLIPGHDKIAYLSQHFKLRNNYRVEEIFDYSNRLDEAQASTLFELCNVRHLLKRRTDQLSGGERQRIALARVLITAPKLLLLDEPFSNLDPGQKSELKKAIVAAATQYNLTTVLVSHDPGDLLSWADVIHVLRNGRIVQSGNASDLYYYPDNDYVAALFGSYNKINDSLRELFAAAQMPIPETLKFLRPDRLAIAGENHAGVHGVITSVSFMGNFSLVHVLVNTSTLVCSYRNNQLHTGDRVTIQLI